MDVMGVIYEFIPSYVCRKITKEKYILHYSSFINYITKNNQLDTYTRSLIRKNQTLPFRLLINMKYNGYKKRQRIPLPFKFGSYW